MDAPRIVPLSRPWRLAAALVACVGILGPVGGLLGRAVLADFDAVLLAPETGKTSGAAETLDSIEVGVLGTRWRPVEIDGDGVGLGNGPREPFLVLAEDGRLHGFTGCNRLSGSYERGVSSLTLGPVATTRMACPPGADALETRFLRTLEAVAEYSTEKRTLELRDGTGRVVMRLEERNLD